MGELTELLPEWHPMLPNPSEADVERWCSTAEGRAEYAKFLSARQLKLRNAEDEDLGDPYRHGWQLPHWLVADKQLKNKSGQACLGGKRATKSQRAAHRVVQACMMLPKTRIWCFQGNERTSKAEQQRLIWYYLPAEIKALQGKSRHGSAKVTYSVDNGFASNVLVFPNKSEIHFLTYEMKTKGYQGWKLGVPLNRELQALVDKTPYLFNLGAWLDEDATLPWLETVVGRCTSNKASWLWTFSTMEGLTPALATVTTEARTIEHARAELVSEDQRLADGCPRGHVPTIQESITMERVSIVYFHTKWNPFGNNYQGVADMLMGKPTERIMQDAYGYTKQVKRRAYPLFGAQNIIKATDLPERGTNYQIVDPAGNRMWCSLWVRVAPGNPATFYIYRDWPDLPSYGEWARPGETSNDLDGVEGLAQRSQGFGWGEYKREFLKTEKRVVAASWIEQIKRIPESERQMEAALELMCKHIADPQMRIRAAAAIVESTGKDPIELHENIHLRFIDPRAAADEKHQDSGTTTPLVELAKEQRHPRTGELIAPGLDYLAASGVSIATGMTEVNALLYWDKDQDYCPIVNQPHLFVVDSCKQVIECLLTYTGLGGEKGPWKDFSDLVRYMATSGLEFVDNNAANFTPPRGGY